MNARRDARSPDQGDTRAFVAGEDEAGERLDRFVARAIPERSRAAAQHLIRAGDVLVNGQPARASHRLKAGDRVVVRVPPPKPVGVQPEPLPIPIVYEDDDLLVIDKPAGMVVHPAAGVSSGTLANALVHRYPAIVHVGAPGRPGIVHRLDRGTSGLLVVAKTDSAFHHLHAQFKGHTAERVYAALVCGRPPDEGTIRASIGRSARDRTRLTVGGLNPREAVTHFRVVERFEPDVPNAGSLALLDIRLETGRTHQIRVHLSDIGYPVAGDPVYGGGAKRAAREAIPELRPLFEGLSRQLLHARRLRFTHPRTDESCLFDAELPEDFRTVLERLRASRSGERLTSS